MNNYVLVCAICRLILNEKFFDEKDPELLAIKMAHQENSETKGHEMKVIEVNRSVMLDHLIVLPRYHGYRLAEIK